MGKSLFGTKECASMRRTLGAELRSVYQGMQSVLSIQLGSSGVTSA